jgi:hypothetical protein
MGTSDEGFVQEYEPFSRQELFIYCRLCRTTFPVVFKPRPQIRLRCVCGHEAVLKDLDVFRSEKGAKDHAHFYEKVYQAAKSALREAGVPLPPSGKFKLDDYLEPGSLPSAEDTDDSDIRSSYSEPPSDEDTTPLRMAAELAELDEKLGLIGDDPFPRHAILSDLIEWSYLRRNHDEAIARRFREACEEDMALAPRLIAIAREKAKAGTKVRLSFTSFKHLAVYLEDEGDRKGALAVCEKATALGLKGYEERAANLRA